MELRTTQSKKIGDFTYEVTQLGAITGSKVFVRLLRMIGPAFVGKNADLGRIFESLKEEDVQFLYDTFAPLTFIPGVGQLDKSFDFHFVGRYMAMVQWLIFCLQVNYGDFLKGKDLGAVGAAMASLSSSPTNVTGQSGVS